MNAKIVDWTVEQYNADTTRLRSSSLRTILEPQGPRAFYLKHVAPLPAIDDGESSKITEMDLGNLLHDYILRGRVGWIVNDDNKNSTKFKEFKKANTDKLILSTSQETKLLRWIDAANRNPEAKRIIEAGYSEVTGVMDYEIEIDGEVETIPCKCRWDILCGDTGEDWDIKTTRATDRRGFERQSTDLGYHVQAGFYDLHKEALGIHLAKHSYIVVMKSDPSYCYVWPVSHQLMEIGRSFAVEALRRVAKCRKDERELLAKNPDANPMDAWPDYLEVNQSDELQPDPWTATRAGTVEAEERGW